MRVLLSILMLTFFVSCSKKTFVEDKVFAGGVHASAWKLNKGEQIYKEYCMACHGVNGDGKGPAHKGMKVPPRDFTLGLFKFGKVTTGELPHDRHFYEILDKGLHGTAMLPWDLTEGQMDAVVQYIKTFAPKVWEGKDKKLGEEILPTKDPFGAAHRSAAIQKGKEVYHAVANCQSCHRGYISLEEYSAINKKVNGDAIDELDEDFYAVKPQETEYGYLNIPPDFTWDRVRSAVSVEDLYVRLAAGVGGTSMPAWKDTITDEEIWAVAYYVRSLMDIRDKPSRKELMSKLK